MAKIILTTYFLLYPSHNVFGSPELEKKFLKLLHPNIQYECTGRTTCAVSRSWRTIQHNGSLYTPTFASVINKYRSFCNDSYCTSSWLPFFVSLRDSITRFFASDFFLASSSPKLLKITLGSFRIVSKIREDIRKSRCTTGINDTGVNNGNNIRLLTP